MIISWFGQSCFKIQGEKTTIVTDPFDKTYGLKVPRLAADIITVSHTHNDHNNIKAVKGITEEKPFVVQGAGEYEIKNVFIYGVVSYHDDQQGKEKGSNTIYRFEIDGVSIAHLGDLGHTLSNGQIEKLEGVDILIVPVGGTYTINSKQAVEVISQIEPRIVIPMHYNISGLKMKNKIANVTDFCKEFGACPTEEIDKLKITKKDLPQQDLKVIILKP